MEYSEVVANRVSIRWFKDEPLPKETLREIVEEAAQAPSWVNSQPWQVYIATGETLKAIKEEHLRLSKAEEDPNPVLEPLSREHWAPRQQQNMADMYAGIMQFLADRGMSGDDFTIANTSLFNAPAIAYLAIANGSSAWSVMDLGGLSYGLMLAAANRGIDSIPAYEFVRYPQHLAEHLHVADGYSVVMGVGLGIRANDAINDWRCGRLPFEEYAQILS